MLKRLSAVVLILAVMSGVFISKTSWGAVTVRDYPYTSSTDIASIYGIVSNTYGSYLYNLYGQDAGFNYQLRELAGNSTAGPQWFATVYENYFYRLYNTSSTTENRGVYRRTMGGEIPDVTVSSVGNLIGGFNFMTLEEPQPYTAITNIYDEYPDPLESLCLVIKNGTGNFNVDFGNPYASHYPYWWRFGTVDGSALWNNRASVRSLNEPVAFLINTSEGIISERDANGNYTDMYTFILSADRNKSGDLTGTTHYEIMNMSGKLAYKTSADDTIVLDSKDNTVYTVSYLSSGTTSGANIYDSDGNLVYTLEDSSSSNIKYLCRVRNVTESVTVDGFEDYSFVFTPRTEQSVNPGDYASTNIRISSTYGTTDFGSKLGYITFNQAADMAPGYTRYRENAVIPLVIANVYDGNAAEVPLLFDMTVYDSDSEKTADHVINRVKFTWDAQSDMNDLDFGTFFMVKNSADAMPTYYLETQITNRTGTRYRLYRYEMGRITGYDEIWPDRWKYDLALSPTQLQRATLPQYFHLDAHSQIAPGLTTIYDHSVYGTVETTYDTYESFQLSEYGNSAPKNLRLNYKRVGGLDLIADSEETLDGVRKREFVMNFADTRHDDDETAYELTNLMGKAPVMTTAAADKAALSAAASSRGKTEPHISSVYINSTAIDAFRFLKAVPDGLVTYTVISEDTESQDITSPESGTPTTDENNPAAATFSPAEVIITLVSNEIPLQPLSIRMRIPRQNQLVVNHWEEFENASNSHALFNAFANYGAIWLRSDSTGELDANFFTAINNKGSNIGAGAADCIRAFIYEDALYLDFIVVLADGSSRNTGKTAYVELFKDDGIPYVLIGDGNENGQWDMTFYIAATGENPTPGHSTTSGDNPSTIPVKPSSGSGGGGGCSLGLLGMIGMLLLLRVLKISRV